MGARRGGLRAIFELLEYLLRPVEDPRLEVVLAELRERGHLLLPGQAGALEQVLVHADRAVILAAPANRLLARVQLDVFVTDRLDRRGCHRTQVTTIVTEWRLLDQSTADDGRSSVEAPSRTASRAKRSSSLFRRSRRV